MRRRLKRLLDWRAALVYTHRWLGIAGCVLFVALVRLRHRDDVCAHAVARARRAAGARRRARSLDGHRLAAEAAKRAGVSRRRCAGRHATAIVRSIGSAVAAAASGNAGRPDRRSCSPIPASCSTASAVDEARAIARRFEPALHRRRCTTTATSPSRISGRCRRARRCRCIASRSTMRRARGSTCPRSTGEVVLRTTRRERFWGYLGPVIHWVYFTPLRQNGPLWTEFVIWSSLIGCVMCVTGSGLGARALLAVRALPSEARARRTRPMPA